MALSPSLNWHHLCLFPKTTNIFPILSYKEGHFDFCAWKDVVSSGQEGSVIQKESQARDPRLVLFSHEFLEDWWREESDEIHIWCSPCQNEVGEQAPSAWCTQTRYMELIFCSRHTSLAALGICTFQHHQEDVIARCRWEQCLQINWDAFILFSKAHSMFLSWETC